MRSGETCERRLPLLGAATASPGRSQAKQNLAILLDSPHLNGLEDLFLATSSAHDHRPIWNFTYPQVASAVQQSAVVDMARQHRTLDAVAWPQAKSMHRTNTAVESQQTTGNLFQKFERYAKNAKNSFVRSCWGRDILCIEHDKN